MTIPITSDQNEVNANRLNLVIGGFNQEFIKSGLGCVWDVNSITTGTIVNTAALAAMPTLDSDSMTSDCSVKIPNTAGSGFGINFTQLTVAAGDDWNLEFWYKTEVSSPISNTIFLDYTNTAATLRIALVLNFTGILRVVFQPTSAAATAFDTTYTVPNNTWVHYSLNRDFTNQVRIYANGVLVTSFTPAAGTLTCNQMFFGCNSSFSSVTPGKVCGIRLKRQSTIRSATFTPPTSIPFVYAGNASVSLTPGFVGDPIEPAYFTTTLDINSQMAKGWAFTAEAPFSFTVPHGCFAPYHVLCKPYMGPAWKPSRVRLVDDFVVPSNAVASSPCFICSVAGTSGATEPVWPTSGSVSDGTVTWDYAGQFHPGQTYSVKDE